MIPKAPRKKLRRAPLEIVPPAVTQTVSPAEVTAFDDVLALIDTAQRRAYQAVESIRFEGMQFRGDIGHRAVAAKK